MKKMMNVTRMIVLMMALSVPLASHAVPVGGGDCDAGATAPLNDGLWLLVVAGSAFTLRKLLREKQQELSIEGGE